MKVQELIDELNKIDDKNLNVILENDGWFNHVIYVNKIELFSEDGIKNISPYREENDKPFTYVKINQY